MLKTDPFDFTKVVSRVKFDMTKLKNVQTKQIMTNKRKDEYQIMNQVKYNSMCPYYAYELPCPNEIMKDYCIYQHNRYARRCERLAAELNEEGLGMTELQAHIALMPSNQDHEEKAKNKVLWKKFPLEPKEEAK